MSAVALAQTIGPGRPQIFPLGSNTPMVRHPHKPANSTEPSLNSFPIIPKSPTQPGQRESSTKVDQRLQVGDSTSTPSTPAYFRLMSTDQGFLGGGQFSKETGTHPNMRAPGPGSDDRCPDYLTPDVEFSRQKVESPQPLHRGLDLPRFPAWPAENAKRQLVEGRPSVLPGCALKPRTFRPNGRCQAGLSGQPSRLPTPIHRPSLALIRFPGAFFQPG